MRFETEFEVDVCKEEEIEMFVREIEKKTGTSYNPNQIQYKAQKWISKRYHCHRNIRDQRAKEVGKGGIGPPPPPAPRPGGRPRSCGRYPPPPKPPWKPKPKPKPKPKSCDCLILFIKLLQCSVVQY
jgi:hypothetical protein